MAKAQRQKIERSDWLKGIAGLVGLAIAALSTLGVVSWKMLAIGTALWPVLLITLWAYKAEKAREEANGTPRAKLNEEWKPRPQDGPQ
jgi:hypothetical protein